MSDRAGLANYIRYRDDVEEFDPDESETFHRIIDVMAKGGGRRMSVTAARCAPPTPRRTVC